LRPRGYWQPVIVNEPLVYYRRHAQQQIGFPTPGWQGALKVARGQTAEACRQESEAYEQLCTRLVSLGVEPRDPVLETLRGKGRLLIQRAEMRSRRSRAPLLMWRGIRDGGYRQYGIGWGQLMLDVVAFGVGAESTFYLRRVTTGLDYAVADVSLADDGKVASY
jgi:hypothetical protein